MLHPILLAALFLASAPAQATIFGIDDRIAASPDGPLRAIGTLTGGANVVYGSGFLIDACTVLSARHVAGADEHVVGRRLTFRSGRRWSAGMVVAAGPFWQGPSELRGIGADWMLVRLQDCIGRELGFLRLSMATAEFAGRHEFKIEEAGFPRDRPIAAGLTVDPDCRVMWVGGGRIVHDCATLPGNSGGPLLARAGSEWVAIGINVAGADRINAKFNPNEVNLAIDIKPLLATIRAVIKTSTSKEPCPAASTLR